jgi:hypothetical protein
MDLQTLKLQLINRILETNDRKVLVTLQRILEMPPAAPPDTGTPSLPTEQGTTDASTQDLQNDIDEIFNPH